MRLINVIVSFMEKVCLLVRFQLLVLLLLILYAENCRLICVHLSKNHKIEQRQETKVHRYEASDAQHAHLKHTQGSIERVSSRNTGNIEFCSVCCSLSLEFATNKLPCVFYGFVTVRLF